MFDHIKDVDELLGIITTSTSPSSVDGASKRIQELGVVQYLTPVGTVFCWQPDDDEFSWNVAGIHSICGEVSFSTQGEKYDCTIGGRTAPLSTNAIDWRRMQFDFVEKIVNFLLKSEAVRRDLQQSIESSESQLR